jgi:CHAT domain-containing protein
MREAMARVPSWLARRVRGTLTEGEDATLASLTGMSLTNRVVHFSTHGYFPPEGDRGAANPYAASGLLLAGPGGLPDLDAPGASAKLSPKELLDSRLDLSGSHISLAACVTGLAREGVGGDALGLDWALFQCGAASLLASHWNVSAALSASFFERFYDRWLLQRMGRAVAWRAAILSMMGEDGPASSPYAWGAFSLSGDWR